MCESSRTCLDEPDILTLLSETLAAEVETVFADETSGVCADSTVEVVLLAYIGLSEPGQPREQRPGT